MGRDLLPIFYEMTKRGFRYIQSSRKAISHREADCLSFSLYRIKILSATLLEFCGLVHISEIVFPSYDVRFIAVNDAVDSATGDNDFTVIRNVFNDFYTEQYDFSTK